MLEAEGRKSRGCLYCCRWVGKRNTYTGKPEKEIHTPAPRPGGLLAPSASAARMQSPNGFWTSQAEKQRHVAQLCSNWPLFGSVTVPNSLGTPEQFGHWQCHGASSLGTPEMQVMILLAWVLHSLASRTCPCEPSLWVLPCSHSFLFHVSQPKQALTWLCCQPLPPWDMLHNW